MDIRLPSPCTCGKTHPVPRIELLSGRGAIEALPEKIRLRGLSRPFLVYDVHTAPYADAVKSLLSRAGIAFSAYGFPEAGLAPDERAAGSLAMHFDPRSDLVIAVGSGVLNDLGKLLAHLSGRSYFIVATAPSMDGFASATSSMDRDGLKVSLPTRAADLIAGDTAILREAPEIMLKAGLGDMLAKYISILEWRISNLVTGESYCEEIASLVRAALEKCVSQTDGLLAREDAAVEAVFEGLVLGGMAMTLAGASRPASGVEHYFSHLFDMRRLAFGTHQELHGVQCAAATGIAAGLYRRTLLLKPDRERALAYVRCFDRDEWNRRLRRLVGPGAEAMIALEEKEGKYDLAKHEKRLDVILAHWDGVTRIIREELPSKEKLDGILKKLSLPESVGALADPGTLREIFFATKDVRDKYVLSRLLWDLGELEEIEVGAL